MKKLLPFIILVIVLGQFVSSCTGGVASEAALLSDAEQEYLQGRYTAAQKLADSISAGDMNSLSVEDLCRLSLLYVRLGERSDEESNMAGATRALDAAAMRDNDSTMAFIESLSVEDRAGLKLVEAVAEGSRHVVNFDSLDVEADSLSL